MIATNDKTLTKPYCLTRIEFLQQFYTFAKERKIKRSTKNLSDFANILGLSATKVFKIEMYNAMQALQDNNRAIAIGLEQVPPIVIANIPVNANLPVALPVQQADIPRNAVDIKRWEILDEMLTDFDSAKMILKEKMKALLPEDIFESLKLKAGIEGWSNVEPADVFDYILSDEFSDLSDANLDVIIKKINQPWNKNITLKSNLESMVKENDNLKAAFPHLALTDQDLFRSAFKISKSDNYRLLPIVNNFMSLPGQHITRSLFSEFADYILKNYLLYSHAKNTNHLAFICENVDKSYDNRFHHALGAAATNSEPEEPTALAAKVNERIVPEKDWADYQKYIADRKKPPKLREGMLCFYHGWNSTHDSTMCALMRNDPKYTADQKAFTKVPPGHNLMIDNLKCNVQCAKGIKPKP
jgi:hypothetical protein